MDAPVHRAMPTCASIAPLKNLFFEGGHPVNIPFVLDYVQWAYAVVPRLLGAPDVPEAEKFFKELDGLMEKNYGPYKMVSTLGILKDRLAGLAKSKHPHLLFSPECYIYCKWFTLYTPASEVKDFDRKMMLTAMKLLGSMRVRPPGATEIESEKGGSWRGDILDTFVQWADATRGGNLSVVDCNVVSEFLEYQMASAMARWQERRDAGHKTSKVKEDAAYNLVRATIPMMARLMHFQGTYPPGVESLTKIDAVKIVYEHAQQQCVLASTALTTTIMDSSRVSQHLTQEGQKALLKAMLEIDTFSLGGDNLQAGIALRNVAVFNMMAAAGTRGKEMRETRVSNMAMEDLDWSPFSAPLLVIRASQTKVGKVNEEFTIGVVPHADILQCATLSLANWFAWRTSVSKDMLPPLEMYLAERIADLDAGKTVEDVWNFNRMTLFNAKSVLEPMSYKTMADGMKKMGVDCSKPTHWARKSMAIFLMGKGVNVLDVAMRGNWKVLGVLQVCLLLFCYLTTATALCYLTSALVFPFLPQFAAPCLAPLLSSCSFFPTEVHPFRTPKTPKSAPYPAPQSNYCNGAIAGKALAVQMGYRDTYSFNNPRVGMHELVPDALVEMLAPELASIKALVAKLEAAENRRRTPNRASASVAMFVKTLEWLLREALVGSVFLRERFPGYALYNAAAAFDHPLWAPMAEKIRTVATLNEGILAAKMNPALSDTTLFNALVTARKEAFEAPPPAPISRLTPRGELTMFNGLPQINNGSLMATWKDYTSEAPGVGTGNTNYPSWRAYFERVERPQWLKSFKTEKNSKNAKNLRQCTQDFFNYVDKAEKAGLDVKEVLSKLTVVALQLGRHCEELDAFVKVDFYAAHGDKQKEGKIKAADLRAAIVEAGLPPLPELAELPPKKEKAKAAKRRREESESEDEA